ncbi:MAG TPA: hypothetical protein VK530_03415 [Candidatus Acidoferrum sp.]|nr:hypothetical protein [Candidatus Acidoferrum sp.]
MRFGIWAGIVLAAVSGRTAELKAGELARDQFAAPFVRTVMPDAPRSIAIPLSSNLHVAFDAEKLRLHTAWSGERVGLSGYVTHAQQNPISQVRGTILWSAPAEMPWSTSSNRFRGVSTKGGAVTLLYDLGDSHGWARVHETPSRVMAGSNTGIMRRFEIARGTDAVRMLAFAETAEIISTNAHAVVLRRSNDLVLLHHSGVGSLQAGRGSNGEVRITANLDANTNTAPQVFELVTVVCPTNAEWQVIVSELAKHSPATPNLSAAHPRATTPVPMRVITFPGATTPGRIDGNESFKREQVPIPKELDALVGGLDWLPGGDLVVVTWPGEIYIACGITNSLTNIVWQRFASGLHEPLGVKWKNGSAYVASKAELTRITDTDGNGEADLFETVSDAWGFDGDSHYFAYGPAMDDAGNFYVSLDGNTGDWRAKWNVPLRGWAVKVRPNGATETIAGGLRSPNGVFSFGGDIFCTDNEGYWIGACKINCLRPGKFFGYPSSTPHPQENFDKPARFDPPTLWFPRKLAPSASGATVVSDTRFGPFTNQLLVGDFFTASLLRVSLEQVNGEWQGAVWPFMKSFLSGVNRVSLGPDGKLYVGCLRRGWTSSGPQEFSLERLTFTGKTPFEVRDVRAHRDGFDLAFTAPVDASAADTNAWNVSQFGYRFHSKYGSPEINHDGKENSATPITVTRAEVSPDKTRVRLFLSGWKTNFVTAVNSSVRSETDAPLRNDTFYYTLNQLPK